MKPSLNLKRIHDHICEGNLERDLKRIIEERIFKRIIEETR